MSPSLKASSPKAGRTYWREERRSVFRSAILGAAEQLIRRTGGTGLSMRMLAQRAHVALVTPYNLFGSKAGVLYALLDEGLGRIDERISELDLPDPIDRVMAVSRIAADLYGKDPALYRPLLRYLSGAAQPGHHPGILAGVTRLYRPAIEQGLSLNLFPGTARVEVVERNLLVNFTGVLHFWMRQELDGVGLRKHILYGSVLALLPMVKAELRAALLGRLNQLERGLPKELGKPTAHASIKRRVEKDK